MTDPAVLARRWRRFTELVAVGLVVVLVIAVAVAVWPRGGTSTKSRAVTNASDTTTTDTTVTTTAPADIGYPGMPPVVDPSNIYSEIGPQHLSPQHQSDPPRVYVPNGRSNTVSVIDPATRTVIATFPTGAEPQHVVPSYDLSTLWVLDNQGNDVIPIDPATGDPGAPLPVRDDPYNLYFTPDGASAIVVAEAETAARLPRPAHDGADIVAARAGMRGDQPRRLQRQWRVPARHVRVRRKAREDRRRQPGGARTVGSVRQSRGRATGADAHDDARRLSGVLDAAGRPGRSRRPSLLRRRHDGGRACSSSTATPSR